LDNPAGAASGNGQGHGISPELKKRVLTGFLGGAVLVGVLVFAGTYGAYLVCLVLSIAMIHEFAGISLVLSDRVEKRWALMLLTWISVWLAFLMPGMELGIFAFCFIVLNAYYMLTAGRHEGPAFATHYKEQMGSVFGLFYVVFLPLFLPLIGALPEGTKWEILFLVIVFAGDTGAYFGGKKWGKRKLYPKLSPNKTVEGAVTGLAAGLVATLLYKVVLLRDMSWLGVLVTPLVVGATAQTGDLCESYLKRAFDRKDSGTILPGHGGFLDRFDGVVFSLPIMYACIKVLG
jgi:phosphatidate cytidylyltransferase